MATRAARLATKQHGTRALILRRVGFGDADLVLTLFTLDLGKISVLARGARRSQRRFSGALEPFHTLRIRCSEREGNELMSLQEATLDTVRARLVSDLDRMQVASRALGWVMQASPPHLAERDVWSELSAMLDRLDDETLRDPHSQLAIGGLRLLGSFGWGLDLARCVRCGKECAAGKPAMVDVEVGGLICRSCGGARIRLPAGVRARLLAVTSADGTATLEKDDANVALDLVERTLAAHVHPR